jgi:hypothetical protein
MVTLNEKAKALGTAATADAVSARARPSRRHEGHPQGVPPVPGDRRDLCGRRATIAASISRRRCAWIALA